jgi:hypothetical protein
MAKNTRIYNIKKHLYTDGCGNTSGEKCYTKEGRKESKIQEFMYRDTMNVEHKMHGDTSKKWGHWNSNKGVSEKKLEATAGKYSIN